MSTKLFVGNLPYSATDEELKSAFAAYGDLGEVVIIKDKFSGRSRGFGFVEVMDDEMALKAVEEMNGKEFSGRNLVVNVSKPREEGERRPFNRDRKPFRREFSRDRF